MKPKAIRAEEFEQEVLNSDGVVIVNFWAPWSRPSRMVFSILEEIGDRYAGELKIVTLNVDRNEKTAREYGVNKIPTLLFFDAGKVVDKGEGISSVKYLDSRLRELIPVAA